MADEIRLSPGDKAPQFKLTNQDGIVTKLADYKGQWVVLYFYPKDDTPGCTTEACEFTDNFKQFEKLNAMVLGVSPDKEETHRKFIAKYKINFNLLSDPDKLVLQQYGAFGTKKMYGKVTKGVIRSTFLIDPKGKIAQVWYNVKAKGHAARVMEELSDLTV